MIDYAPISLQALKTSAYLFYKLSGYDPSYTAVKEHGPLDPRRRADGRIILHFLRSWGCRHLAHHHEREGLRALRGWYDQHAEEIHELPTAVQIKKKHLPLLKDVFDALSGCLVSPRNRNITMGPVATSKTLLLIKGNLFAPWDNGIIVGLDTTADGEGYAEYLQRIQQHLKELSSECRQRGTSIHAIMHQMTRAHYELPKLIDEYYYLRFTRKLDAQELVDVLY